MVLNALVDVDDLIFEKNVQYVFVDFECFWRPGMLNVSSGRA